MIGALNNLRRFLNCDSAFRKQFVIAAVLPVVVIAGLLFLRLESKTLSRVKTERLLVTKIGEMEYQLKYRKEMKTRTIIDSKPQPKPQVYILEGTSLQNGILQSVINGTVCRVGDHIDNFIVTDITMNSATLYNSFTNETKTLQFADPLKVQDLKK